MKFLNKFWKLSRRHDLVSALERIIELLENSEDSDWSNLTAGELAKVLSKELSKIKNNQEFDKREIAILFAPTGNIQETAIWNDWHKEYLEISEVIDGYTK
jgi:hypothetical protein